MKIVINQLPLIAILLIAFFLRIVEIGSLPPSPTWDEVAWGYNAYSLGIDLHDEFGKFLPVTYLESFGDYKPPLYAYLTILPVKIFGLNIFAVRFASVIFGFFTVILTYFLTKRLLGDKDKIKIGKLKIDIPLLSTFILAISPWHILLSRAAFEANVATFFIVLGVFLFLISTDTKRKWFLLFSVISFVLSMYTFNTARIVVPMLFSVLLIGKYKSLFKMKKEVLLSGFVGLILFLPLLFFLQTPQAKLRFQEVNIFTDSSIVVRANQQIENDENALWSKIIHNRRFAFGAEYLNHYFDNLTPSFLFIKGDGNPKFSIQDVGQMYIWEIPFFVLGILFLFRKKEKYWWLIPVWIIIGIAPAATARETPHALRIESLLPTFQILTAYGVIMSFAKIKGSVLGIKFSYGAFYLLALAVIINFAYFFHNYLTHYSRTYSKEWQYGYKDAIAFTESVKNDYDRILFTTELGRPHEYVLFYTRYDPVDYRKNAKVERDVFGFVHVKGFDKYLFENNVSGTNIKNSLYIDVPEKVPDKARILREFKLLNGQIALIAYTL